MRVVASTNQLTLELQLDVRKRFGSLRECLHWSVLNDPRGIKAVAADCDLSVSELSRRLHPSDDDPRSCDVNLMVKVMHSTRDLSPLHWLMAEFLQDEARPEAIAEALSLLLDGPAAELQRARLSAVRARLGAGGAAQRAAAMAEEMLAGTDPS